jgi:hypothetical protein
MTEPTSVLPALDPGAKAIKAKLQHQAAYVLWRQDVAVPSQITGGHGRMAELSSGSLPALDPGKPYLALPSG